MRLGWGRVRAGLALALAMAWAGGLWLVVGWAWVQLELGLGWLRAWKRKLVHRVLGRAGPRLWLQTKTSNFHFFLEGLGFRGLRGKGLFEGFF